MTNETEMVPLQPNAPSQPPTESETTQPPKYEESNNGRPRLSQQSWNVAL